MESRNLYQLAIEKLASKKFDSDTNYLGCPRCGSCKWIANSVEWTETYEKLDREDEIAASNGFWHGKVTYKDEIIC